MTMEASPNTTPAVPRVLVVEDESDIAALIAYQLTRDGFRVETARTGTEALDAVGREIPDLVVLDRMLPGLSGDEVLARLRREHPYIDVSTLEGPYDDLAAALRCGDIDLMLGALRGPDSGGELLEETLFIDQLSIIVRADHPLTGRKNVALEDLLAYGWVMPRKGTPTRHLIESAIVARALPMPEHVVETSSLVVLRGLLMETDYVTPLSRHQVFLEERHGMLAPLPIELGETRRPIGITRRAGGSIPPAAELLASELRQVIAEKGLGRDQPAAASAGRGLQ